MLTLSRPTPILFADFRPPASEKLHPPLLGGALPRQNTKSGGTVITNIDEKMQKSEADLL
jgi:hypothetical protein